MDSRLARLGLAVAFLFVLAIVGGPLCHVRQYTSTTATSQENECLEPIRIKVGGDPMNSLNEDVERQLIEMRVLSIPAVILAGIFTLNITSAVLALLAA